MTPIIAMAPPIVRRATAAKRRALLRDLRFESLPTALVRTQAKPSRELTSRHVPAGTSFLRADVQTPWGVFTADHPVTVHGAALTLDHVVICFYCSLAKCCRTAVVHTDYVGVAS